MEYIRKTKDQLRLVPGESGSMGCPVCGSQRISQWESHIEMTAILSLPDFHLFIYALHRASQAPSENLVIELYLCAQMCSLLVELT